MSAFDVIGERLNPSHPDFFQTLHGIVLCVILLPHILIRLIEEGAVCPGGRLGRCDLER